MLQIFLIFLYKRLKLPVATAGANASNIHNSFKNITDENNVTISLKTTAKNLRKRLVGVWIEPSIIQCQ